LFARGIWALFLRFAFKFYVRLRVKGSFRGFYKKYPKLIIISNHASHLDGPAILTSIPFSHWMDLYILAAKDYWFSSRALRFFSKYFLGAIPVDRKVEKTNSVKKCINFLNDLKRIWIVMFPEGTRSLDGSLRPFKNGVGLFSKKTNTPVLFLYLRKNRSLWPKGKSFPLPGKMYLHVGPVHEPGDTDVIFNNYKKWTEEVEENIRRKKRFRKSVKKDNQNNMSEMV
jgi:1-acyl-sn-glycerol-3-phosphate acyltransferase